MNADVIVVETSNSHASGAMENGEARGESRREWIGSWLMFLQYKGFCSAVQSSPLLQPETFPKALSTGNRISVDISGCRREKVGETCSVHGSPHTHRNASGDPSQCFLTKIPFLLCQTQQQQHEKLPSNRFLQWCVTKAVWQVTPQKQQTYHWGTRSSSSANRDFLQRWQFHFCCAIYVFYK